MTKKNEQQLIFDNASKINSMKRKATNNISVLNENYQTIKRLFPFFATPELTIILSTLNRNNLFDAVDRLCKTSGNVPYVTIEYVQGLISEGLKHIYGWEIEDLSERSEKGFLMPTSLVDDEFCLKYLEFDKNREKWWTNKAFDQIIESLPIYTQNEKEVKALEMVREWQKWENEFKKDKIVSLQFNVINVPEGVFLVEFIRYLSKMM